MPSLFGCLLFLVAFGAVGVASLSDFFCDGMELVVLLVVFLLKIF